MFNSSSSRRHYLSGLFLSLALIACFAGAAKAQSALDGFDPNANGSVEIVVIQPDGKILIGGTFTTLAPNGGAAVTRNRIARLNADGTLDTAFNPNANNPVYAIAVQADGKILVGGVFSIIGGQTRILIARLDAVTGLADSFNPNTDNVVQAIAVQADGGILVGGLFTTMGGQTRNRIARLDAATGLADSFNPNASSDVNKLVVQADGKILVGGSFTTIGGQSRSRMARLDSATGLADSFNPNANSTVFAIAKQADGRVLAAGNFTNIGGQTRNRIARLDPVTGSADTFNPNASGSVNTIAVQADGKILAAGNFTSIGGQTRNRIARLDVNGVADAFDPNVNNAILSIAVQTDGKVLAGGIFTTLSPNGGTGLTRNQIARLENDGRADRTLNAMISGTNGGTLEAIAIQPDGKILIGGSFNTVLGVTRTNIARLHSDGSLDTAFSPNANDTVYSIAVQADGKVLVGGTFDTIGGASRSGIARVNATTGAADSWNPSPNGTVFPIVVQADGKILVGGTFTSIGGSSRNFIARLDAVTGLADPFNPNANVTVFSIAIQDDGRIVVGGIFTTIGGQSRTRLARLDASTGVADSWNPNGVDSNYIHSVAIQPDGKILAGGSFANIGGAMRNNLVRLDPVTAIADSWNPDGNSAVESIVFQADGKIIVSGTFTAIGGAARNRIARLDALTGLADSWNPVSDFFVSSLAIQPDGKILAGGDFSNAGGQTRKSLARLTNDTIATQSLGVGQTFVTWRRGGSSSRFSRVTFEDSIDGVNFNFLGNGVMSGSDWTLAGINLSLQNLYIRARGHFQGGRFNGSGSITEFIQNAIPGPVVSGTITYGNAIGSPAPPRFVKNVSVVSTVGSPAVGPVITGTQGTYRLTGFGTGGYTIKPTKPGGSNSAITSNDAARVAQGVSASMPFVSSNQKFASDASGNGTVSSNDAALIARFAAGLTGTGNVGQWRFFTANLPGPPSAPLPTPPYNDTRNYASVTSNATGEDYVALLIGEASGNWNPATHPRPATGPERNTVVELPQIITPTDKDVIIPVSIQRAAGKEIISYQFDIRYDPAVIQPNKNPVDLARTVSRGLMVVTNPNEPGLLRVVVYGPTPIDGDGVLLNLRFTAVGKPGSVSPLAWERIMFNEGEPRVSTTDGQVELF